MTGVKQYVSEWIDIDEHYLNEITLEDIELAEAARRRIQNTIEEITPPGTSGSSQSSTGLPPWDLPCQGFWVEGTRDLVLCLWSELASTAIIVPSDGWKIIRRGMLH